MKIGIIQLHIIWEDKEANIDKLEHMLDSGLLIDADIILLPEMSFTGFSMNTEMTGEIQEETKYRIKKLCKKHCKAVAFGWVKNKNHSENHYTVINEEGVVVSDYIKIHPFSYLGEDKHFVSGKRVGSFELKDSSFSTLICYDLRFPELFRLISKKASVIIVPANWPMKRNDHWETLLKARAIENQVYVIGVNCVGSIGGLDYSGNSCVISPDGEILLSLKGTESYAIWDYEDDVWKYRNEFPTYRDRKDKLYLDLQKGTLGWT